MFDKWYSDNVYQPGPTLTTELDKSDQQISDRTWEIYLNFCEAGKKHVAKSLKDKHSKKLFTEINLNIDDMSMLFLKNFQTID